MSNRPKDAMPRIPKDDPPPEYRSIRQAIEEIDDRDLKRAAERHIDRISRLDMTEVGSFATLASLHFGQMLLSAALIPQNPKIAGTCSEMRKCLEGMTKAWGEYLDRQFPDEVRRLVEAALTKQREAFEEIMDSDQRETFRRRLLEEADETD
jgi:DNA-binding GntR family transcriptional regulator